ncbi:hypothetical protein HI914_06696 [Erysiphe necator]|nr:hypothetical protein HI914_06696 [Erysiphe necator]
MGLGPRFICLHDQRSKAIAKRYKCFQIRKIGSGRFTNSVNGRAPNRAAERIEKLSPYKPDGTSHSGLLYGGFRLESQPQDLSLCKIYRYGKLRFNEAVSFCRDLEDFRISTSISFKRSYMDSNYRRRSFMRSMACCLPLLVGPNDAPPSRVRHIQNSLQVNVRGRLMYVSDASFLLQPTPISC